MGLATVDAVEPAPNLTTLQMGVRQRRLALVIAVGLLVALSPVARLQTAVIPLFLPLSGVSTIVVDAVVAVLLLGQFWGTRSPALAVLAATYLYSCVIVVPHLLTVPGLFAPQGLLGAREDTAVWLWAFWHGGYACGLLAYVGVHLRGGSRPVSGPTARKITLLILGGVPLLVVVLTILSTTGQPHLPLLIMAGGYTRLLTSGVGIAVWLLNVGVCATLWIRLRGRTAAQLWLGVAALASLVDVSLTLIGGARYSIGWYGARLNALAAALIVLGALLYEINLLYAVLARQRRLTQEVNVQLRSTNEELGRLAREDVLTGLPNRRSLLAVMHARMALHAARTVSVLIVDIDNFKQFNDRFGHSEGDRVLKAAASVMAKALRSSDLVGRFGGGEFVVMLPGAELEHVVMVGNRLMKAVRTHVLIIEGAPRPLTISIGAATAQSGETPDDLLRRADAALYEAKREGKDRLVLSEGQSVDVQPSCIESSR